MRAKYKPEDYLSGPVLSSQLPSKQKLSSTDSNESCDLEDKVLDRQGSCRRSYRKDKETPPPEEDRSASPVMFRQKDVRKLVELKQPEPSAISRMSEDKKRSWTTTKDVWRSITPPTRPSDLNLDTQPRESSPVINRNSDIGTSRINFGHIDESVNVKERATLFGSRKTEGKLRTVSVGSCAQEPGKQQLQRTQAVEHKLRTVSIGSEKPAKSEEKNPRKFSSGANFAATSPSKIKNMAALFESK